jgi:hypothetical protein
MVCRMTLAFVSAYTAGRRACFDRGRSTPTSTAVWRAAMCPVVVQMSLQSRQSRMQRTRSSTSGSARSASAQLVQLSAQSEHSSIHRMSTARSTLVGCGCVWTISRTVTSAPPSRSLRLCRNAPSACPRSTSSSSDANGMPLLEVTARESSQCDVGDRAGDASGWPTTPDVAGLTRTSRRFVSGDLLELLMTAPSEVDC